MKYSKDGGGGRPASPPPPDFYGPVAKNTAAKKELNAEIQATLKCIPTC